MTYSRYDGYMVGSVGEWELESLRADNWALKWH